MFRAVLLATILFVGVCSAQLEFEQVPLPDGRIVGGTDASIFDYPHQISMRYFGRHRCGGSIYSANIIISASHCVTKVDARHMTIVAGSSLLSEYNVELPVKKIIIHPKYRTLLHDYDVAILVVGGFFPFGAGIQPIALAKEVPEEDTVVTVTGWGTELFGTSLLPDRLKKVDVNIVGKTNCRKAYNKFMVTDRMVCAAVTGGGKDACQGDSGGPLIVGNELLGVVSWGNGCADPSFPGVYASVPYMIDWIVETAENNTIMFA